MRLMPFACLGSTEIANVVRTTSYGACEFFDGSCPCPALDADYVSPSADPAPWYDVDHPESADFLGFLPQSITLSPPASRTSQNLATVGVAIGRERLAGRVVDVQGWMVARSLEAMWWGERWLTEALRADPCDDCVSDELTVLPYCRDDGDAGDFRTLRSAALVDGPRFSELSDDPSFFVFQSQFQLVASMPWLNHPPDRCLDAEPLVGTLSCGLDTPDLVEDGTFVIEVANVGTTDVTDVEVSGRISLDGSCPVTGAGTSVPPSFTYEVPLLAPGDRIVIDGTRRQARYYDASSRLASSALPYLTWEGPFRWPDAGPCTTMCLEIVSSGGDAEVTVDGYLRDL